MSIQRYGGNTSLERFYQIVSLKVILMIKRLEDLKYARMQIRNFTIIQQMGKDIALNINIIVLLPIQL